MTRGTAAAALVRASLMLVTVAVWPAPLVGQAPNTLSAQERAQGWQLVFDGQTLAGWHVSAPPPAAGRSGPAQPPQLGQVGTPKPCVAAGSGAAVPPGGSHWEVVDGVLSACGEPTGYLTSDRGYRNFVLSNM